MSLATSRWVIAARADERGCVFFGRRAPPFPPFAWFFSLSYLPTARITFPLLLSLALQAYYNVPHWAADEGEIARPATAAQAVSSDKVRLARGGGDDRDVTVTDNGLHQTVVFTDLKLFKALARRVRRHFSAAGGAPLFLRDAVVNSNVHATVPVRVLGNVVEADETLDELMEQAGGRFGSTPNDFAYEASVLVASGFQTPPAKFGLDGADTWIAYAPEAHAAVVASASGRPDAAAVRRAVELVGAHKLAEAPRNAVYLPGVDAFDLEGKDGSVLVVGDKEAATAGIAGLAPFATDGVVLASGGVSRFWANPEAKANVVQPPKAVLFLGAAKDGSVAAKDVTARLVAAAGLDPKKATSFAKAVDAVVGEIGAKAVDVKKGGDVKKALAGLL